MTSIDIDYLIELLISEFDYTVEISNYQYDDNDHTIDGEFYIKVNGEVNHIDFMNFIKSYNWKVYYIGDRLYMLISPELSKYTDEFITIDDIKNRLKFEQHPHLPDMLRCEVFGLSILMSTNERSSFFIGGQRYEVFDLNNGILEDINRFDDDYQLNIFLLHVQLRRSYMSSRHRLGY